MTRTRIDWCDWTWNPVWGCRNSCEWCYARKIAKRFGLQVAGRDDFVPTWIERNFLRPMPQQPARIFVDSMSDLADWETVWTGKVFGKIRENPQHLFLFLSKRPWNCECFDVKNTMLGYSATNANSLLPVAKELYDGNVAFLSLEPLLADPDIWRLADHARYIRWIIVGAETGNRRDRVVPERPWLQEIFHFCRTYQVPLFFKASLRQFWPASAEFPQEYPADFPRSL